MHKRESERASERERQKGKKREKGGKSKETGALIEFLTDTRKSSRNSKLVQKWKGAFPLSWEDTFCGKSDAAVNMAT